MIPLKRRPAWILAVLGLVLSIIYIESYADPGQYLAHREAAVSWTGLTLLFSSGVAAVSSALEAGRDRASCGPLEDATRPRWMVVAHRVWPGLVAGWLVQTLAAGWMLVKAGPAPDPFPVQVLVTLFSVILVHSLLGYVVGRWLKPLFSVPLTVVALYGWLGFVSVYGYLPIGALPGMAINDCCSADTTMRSQVMWSIALFSVLISAALLLAAVAPKPGQALRWTQAAPTVRCAAASLVVAGLAFAVGLGVGSGVGSERTRTVHASALRCEGQRPQVCLTAVQRARFDPTKDIQMATRSLAAAGLPRITKVAPSEGTVLTQGGVASMVVDPTFTRQVLAHSVASTYSTRIQEEECFGDGPDAKANEREQAKYLAIQNRYSDASVILDVWNERHVDEALGVEVLSGPDASTLEAPKASLPAWKHLLRLPRKDQDEWIASAYRDLIRCKVPARPTATAGGVSG